MTRTTEPPSRPSRKRSTRAATTKIVLSGCSTGLALGIVGVMALADSSAPEAELVTTPAPQARPAAASTTLPPKRIVTYIYRPVLVPDDAPESGRVVRPTSRAQTAGVPAPRPAPRTPARAVAPTTTTTKAS